MPTVITLEGARRLPSFLTSTKFNPSLGNAVGDFILKQNPVVAGLAAAALAFGGGLALVYAGSWGAKKVGLSGAANPMAARRQALSKHPALRFTR